VIKTINATKNFNAVAIITTPKGNSLCKNTSYDVWIVKIGPPVFYTAHPFTQLPNPMLYNTFQSARHPQKRPFSLEHLQPYVLHVLWVHPTHHSKLHLDWFSHFRTAQDRESLSFTMCTIKKINTAINAIKVNHFTALVFMCEQDHYIVLTC